jgi:hypothetical protein
MTLIRQPPRGARAPLRVLARAGAGAIAASDSEPSDGAMRSARAAIHVEAAAAAGDAAAVAKAAEAVPALRLRPPPGRMRCARGDVG